MFVCCVSFRQKKVNNNLQLCGYVIVCVNVTIHEKKNQNTERNNNMNGKKWRGRSREEFNDWISSIHWTTRLLLPSSLTFLFSSSPLHTFSSFLVSFIQENALVLHLSHIDTHPPSSTSLFFITSTSCLHFHSMAMATCTFSCCDLIFLSFSLLLMIFFLYLVSVIKKEIIVMRSSASCTHRLTQSLVSDSNLLMHAFSIALLLIMACLWCVDWIFIIQLQLSIVSIALNQNIGVQDECGDTAKTKMHCDCNPKASEFLHSPVCSHSHQHLQFVRQDVWRRVRTTAV